MVVLRGNGIPPQLAAVVPGRERPLPLLSVTEEDARLHGTTPERLAERWRRDQRYRSLLVVLQRLANLLGAAIGAAWIVVGIPLLSELSSNALLAGGAVLGALALVFQGMLRDFIAGLVALVDDRYAIGDLVEIGGLQGEVLDVGVLSTEVRTVDQKVVVMPNSGCDRIVNHTKQRSGAEVTLLHDRERADLPRAPAA